VPSECVGLCLPSCNESSPSFGTDDDSGIGDVPGTGDFSGTGDVSGTDDVSGTGNVSSPGKVSGSGDAFCSDDVDMSMVRQSHNRIVATKVWIVNIECDVACKMLL
jgi:hypothetical protein